MMITGSKRSNSVERKKHFESKLDLDRDLYNEGVQLSHS